MQFNSGMAVVVTSLLIGASGCTKNFEGYNTNPAELTSAQTIAALPTAFGPLEQNIYHNYQTAQNLSADAYGGYFMPPTPFKAQDNLNYFLVDGWDVNGFNDQYDYEMAILGKMRSDGVPTARPVETSVWVFWRSLAVAVRFCNATNAPGLLFTLSMT